MSPCCTCTYKSSILPLLLCVRSIVRLLSSVSVPTTLTLAGSAIFPTYRYPVALDAIKRPTKSTYRLCCVTTLNTNQ
ncbi:hypothetical protein B0T13DRAFT_463124 [Neurospora crassa]|nr:hypothetical protein B0T13DRAFT_463124 [Neurospora crassa]